MGQDGSEGTYFFTQGITDGFDFWGEVAPAGMWESDRHGLYLGLEVGRRLRGEPSLPPYDDWVKLEKDRRGEVV